MAKQPRQQQLKTSFLRIQLQAPPARALPAQSPAAAASRAVPGGLEEGHIFPSAGTGFLEGWDLEHTQGLAAPSWSLLHEEEPAALRCSSPKEKKREEKSQHQNVKGGGAYRSPHCGHCLVPASRKLGLSCGLPKPAAVMSHGSSTPSMGWKHWPVLSAPQDLWSLDHLSRNGMGCPSPQAPLAPAADRSHRALQRGEAATFQRLPESYGEEPGTIVSATRAQLYRYCPVIQISRSCPAPPAALPLQVRTSVCLSRQTPATHSARRMEVGQTPTVAASSPLCWDGRGACHTIFHSLCLALSSVLCHLSGHLQHFICNE